ncbi:unnamed protein product [Cyprideis torosa]|uniref:Uncharacterized protein n=1 Tax=Cyprideis torosa TaxID=163714 RepID=A0A7R8ZVI2_9CRUS|nr:unnamed protein product [Cyprideis torosa]CAG0902793.1 unnamed protein product [Cyprideis torosa]
MDTDNAAVDGSTMDMAIRSASPAKPPGQILQIVPILLEDICDSSHRVIDHPIQVGKPYFRRNEISFAECVIPRRETGTDRPTLPEYPVAHPYVVIPQEALVFLLLVFEILPLRYQPHSWLSGMTFMSPCQK